ncbi:MAG TPA: hypothetical protein VMW63_04495 [Methanoregulaceae archaeon]|nr:hypothetical protein [Methanoregulaceae archaeon]
MSGGWAAIRLATADPGTRKERGLQERENPCENKYGIYATSCIRGGIVIPRLITVLKGLTVQA